MDEELENVDKKGSWRDNIEMILVEPGEPGNIGSTARAMNNMGFLNLGLVKPPDPFVTDFSKKMAWNSNDIMENANVYNDLPSAIADKGYVVAMSRRQGKDRGHIEDLTHAAKRIVQMAQKSKIAILFGRESHGLENEELLYANCCVKIYTETRFPSLNLAQAVLVTAYELLTQKEIVEDEKPLPATSEELEMCYSHVERILKVLGYGVRGERLLPTNILGVMRKMAGRAILDRREVRMIRGLCSQVEKLVENFEVEKKAILDKEKES